MRNIPVSGGLFAVVDDADYDRIFKYTWTSQKGKCGTVYAYRVDRSGPTPKKIYMHSAIANTPDGMRADHISGDGLDNRQANLRNCTNQQNMCNISHGRGKSRFKGVAWFGRDSRWRAYIVRDAKQIHLGYFDDELSAARAYDAAARKLFGEFAHPNF